MEQTLLNVKRKWTYAATKQAGSNFSANRARFGTRTCRVGAECEKQHLGEFQIPTIQVTNADSQEITEAHETDSGSNNMATRCPLMPILPGPCLTLIVRFLRSLFNHAPAWPHV